jgi:hypothetical protein
LGIGLPSNARFGEEQSQRSNVAAVLESKTTTANVNVLARVIAHFISFCHCCVENKKDKIARVNIGKSSLTSLAKLVGRGDVHLTLIRLVEGFSQQTRTVTTESGGVPLQNNT